MSLPWNEDTYTFGDYMSDLSDLNRCANSCTCLKPGTYIGAPWGHYQGQRIIELAQSLGWPDPNSDETDRLREKYPDLEEEENEIWQETVEEAEQWINDNLVPEGYWFGHHSDIGDVGVWEVEDE